MKTLLLLILCTLSAQAQVTLRSAAYPTLFRAAGSFTPASLTNLFLWYNASAATNDPGTGAEYLVDQSGNGRNMNQSTSGNRATYNTNEVNGLAAWTFDGSDDSYGGSYNAGSSFGVFVLTKQTVANDVSGLFDSGPHLANVFRFWNAGVRGGNAELHDNAPVVSTPSNTAGEIAVYDFRAQVTGGRALDVAKNLGTIVTGTNVSTTAVIWSSPRIGNVNNGAPYFSAKVVQIIITSPYGSGTDRTNIVNYLKGLGGL